VGSRRPRARASLGGLLAALAATALSTLLYGLAFPPVSAKPLAAVALVPFLLALRGAGPGRAVLLGVVWSVLASYAVGDAMPGSMASYFERSAAEGWLVFLVIAVGSAVPFYTPFALAYRPLARRVPPPARALVVAAAWTAAELGRGRVLGWTPLGVANPWALLGYAQVGFETALQVASVTGIYGVSFVLAAANAALADLLLAARGGRAARRPALAGVGLAAGLAAALLAFGAAVLARAPEPGATAGHHRIALVQGNRDLGSRWRPEFYGRNLEAYLRLSLRAVDGGSPEVIFWPEGAFTFLLEEEPAYRSALARLTRGADVELVAGGPGLGEGEDGERLYFNSVFSIDPEGRVRARYDKRYLLPISEFIPLESVGWLRERFEDVDQFTRGTRTAPLPTRLGPAGVLVCNEGMLPEVAAARVREGAAYLVNPSNDSWLGRERWGEMMFDLISVRAIEQRRDLVRVSTSGPSGVVDAWGRVRPRTAPLSEAVAHGAVRPREGRTLYARWGDAFALVCTGAALGALALRPRAASAARRTARLEGTRRSQTRPRRSSPRRIQ